ncbi:hypothetical protein FE391_36310 [Nonomuraea sp. KC401]|uniref:hypothetical protein n=1 Tax=unclassified Nonomuraea TaxID=2593643 RepID=UPI0010FEFD43|nr:MULTISPECIES: hypothetical protein [unclassified Nonomuraea]NBE99037.1 hypothetical protein [Nonomuraea sp. K271]TLF58564.1 hypothetical protein FE391_36310 [Nonomuraea sp. KC401]
MIEPGERRIQACHGCTQCSQARFVGRAGIGPYGSREPLQQAGLPGASIEADTSRCDNHNTVRIEDDDLAAGREI